MRNPQRWILLLLFLLTGCQSVIAPYDETAYRNATFLKGESLYLFSRATESFTAYEGAVQELQLKLHGAKEYAAGMPKNSISAKQWQVLLDEEKGPLGIALSRWRKEGNLSRGYVMEASRQIAMAFDLIICLEINKLEPRPCSQAETGPVTQ